MKAVVFIDDGRDKAKLEENGLEVIINFLGLEGFDYVMANVPFAIHRIIEEDKEVGVVVTAGCKAEVQAIATAAGKLVIEFQKDKKVFSPIKTYEGDAEELKGSMRIWTRNYYSLLD